MANYTGTSNSETIIGSPDGDIIDGLTGRDTLRGGNGDDIYFVELVLSHGSIVFEDSVVENANQGDDTINLQNSGFVPPATYSTLVLPDNVENITAHDTGLLKLNLTGNKLDNHLTGNDADNILDGGAGNDRLEGGLGNDTYILDNEFDRAVENPGEGVDTIRIAYSNLDKVTEDIVQLNTAVFANIENITVTGTGLFHLIGSADDNILVGNIANNTIEGGMGNDYLDGGAGIDHLDGGDGDDTYVIDNLGDMMVDSSGIDTVVVRFTSGTYSLVTAGENFENLTLDGTANINGTGNSQDNVMFGNAGNNILDGGLGDDQMHGGKGNDTFIVAEIGDIVFENPNEGTDTVLSSRSYTLNDNVENLTLTGLAAIDGTGNALNNVIIGNDANNVLYGGDGVDTLRGGKGDDTYLVDLVSGKGDAVLQDIIVENTNEGVDTLIVLNGSFSSLPVPTTILLGSNLENLDISQTFGLKLNITGNTANNILTGNTMDNIIDGGLSTDTMYGGQGNDTYVFNVAADKAIENANEGNDTIVIAYNNADKVNYQTIDLSLPEFNNIENTTLHGTGLFNLTGNDLDNILLGNASVNTLIGGEGQDYLDGGAGVDILNGGNGDDTYVVDNSGDIITDNSGTDTVIVKLGSGTYTLASGLENLTLFGTASLNGTGNDDHNILLGNDGNNILNGGLGADDMSGGKGNDTYIVDDPGDTVMELVGHGTDLVQSSISFALGDNVENLTLTGISAINGMGNALANIIIGNDANNILDGQTGVDTLQGHKGDDTYIVDLVLSRGAVVLEDKVVENANEGTDTLVLRSSGLAVLPTVYTTLALGSNLENMDASATGNLKLNLTGNSLDNLLTGNDADNILDGGLGDDVIHGGKGNDTYIFHGVADHAVEEADAGADTIQIAYNNMDTINYQVINLSQTDFANIENVTLKGSGLFSIIGNDLNNTLIGNASNNMLTGGIGNDYLDGGAGIDTLDGGTGNDTYVIDSINDHIVDADGVDTIIAMGSYSLLSTTAEIENLILSGKALNGTGNDLDNTITGNDFGNILDGGWGADVLIGGKGNDTYIVDNIGDTVTELLNSGTDLVKSSVTFTLGDNIENLTLTGSDAVDGTGNNLSNIIYGNDGNNILDGIMGVDALHGGKGDDTYIIDLISSTKSIALQDSVAENANEGIDTIILRDPSLVILPVVFATLTLGSNIENMDASHTGNLKINLTGNTLDNILTGNDENNVLNGGAGNDHLIGGLGADTLIGGIGNDHFIYQNATESTLAGMDHIVDFATGDIVTFTGALGLSFDPTPYASGQTTVQGAIDAINADSTANNSVVFFTMGADGYLYVKGAGTGTDYGGTLICLDKHAMPLSADAVQSDSGALPPPMVSAVSPEVMPAEMQTNSASASKLSIADVLTPSSAATAQLSSHGVDHSGWHAVHDILHNQA